MLIHIHGAVWSTTNTAQTVHRCLIPALFSDKGKLKAHDAPPHTPPFITHTQYTHTSVQHYNHPPQPITPKTLQLHHRGLTRNLDMTHC